MLFRKRWPGDFGDGTCRAKQQRGGSSNSLSRAMVHLIHPDSEIRLIGVRISGAIASEIGSGGHGSPKLRRHNAIGGGTWNGDQTRRSGPHVSATMRASVTA